MTSFNRSTVTRSALTATNMVTANGNGLGARFDGFRADRPATALIPGATPSRGYAGIDPPRHLRMRDCQSPAQARTRSAQVAMWRPKQAAKPVTPN